MALGLKSLTSAVSGYFGGRSADWWTGPNSVWGKVTGQPSQQPISAPKPNYLVIGAVVYILFFHK